MSEQWLIDPEVVGAVLALVWPGLVSIHVYRLLIPSARLDWAQGILQGFFFTVIDYVLGLPLLLFLLRTDNLEHHPIVYWTSLILLWLVGPVVLPVFWKWIRGKRFLGRYLQQPYITPWDFYFDRRQPVFMLIHLNNGHLLAGYWGPGSYASGYPEQGDLYLSAVYSVDTKGQIGKPIPSTQGLLITKDQYTYIELFEPA